MSVQKSTMPTQSVTRALAILLCFSEEEPLLRGSDIAKKLDLTPSNVSRLLSTMESIGFVEKDHFSGCYRLGPEIISLSGIALNNYEIRKQALPELHKLEQELQLGANLAILYKGKMFYLAHVDSHKSPRMYTMVGYRNPLHCTGIGKVLLAHLEKDKFDSIIKQEDLYPLTQNTITNKEDLLKELENVKNQGYAIEKEELALGRACIAAPVRGRTGEVIGGISISGSLSDMNLEEREQELARKLIETTDLVSLKMGYITVSNRL